MGRCNEWLQECYNVREFEWAYQEVFPRRVVIEPLIRDDQGNLLRDYKLFVFGGEVKMIEVDHDRFTNHTRTLYDPDWNLIDASFKFPQGPPSDRPRRLEDMKAIACRLGKSLDFVRVDLYAFGSTIYFGELTSYPESGYGRFRPQSFDYTLGSFWRLEKN